MLIQVPWCLLDWKGALRDQVRSFRQAAEPIILTVDAKPVAAIVSLKNVDSESLALSTNPEFLRLMQAAREEIESGDFVSLEEIKRELQ